MQKNIKIVLNTVVITLAIVAAVLLIVAHAHKLANFPFDVKYRKAITGNGYVDQIINTSDKVQSVEVTLNNPTLNQIKVYSIVVDAHQFREIGYLQGWAASSGDRIVLECNGTSKKFFIP